MTNFVGMPAELCELLQNNNSTQFAPVIAQARRLGLEQVPLRILLLVFNKQSLTDVLRFLLPEARAIDIAESNQQRTFELCLGFSGDHLESIKQTRIVERPKAEIPPLHIQVISAESLNELAFFEYNLCCQFSQLGIIAAPQFYALTQSDLGAFNLFTNAIEYAGFWVLPEQDRNAGASWLTTPVPNKLNILPAKRVSDTMSLPDFILNENDQKRKQIIEHTKVSQFARILDSVEANFQAEQKKLRARLLLSAFEYAEQEKSHTEEKTQRNNQRQLDAFNDDLKRLGKEAKRESKEKLIGRGLYFQLLESELAGLDTESIEEERQHNTHHLTLKNHVFELIQNRLWEQIEAELRDANGKTFVRLNENINSLGSRVSFLDNGFCQELQGNLNDETDIQGLREHLDIKPRYRGERPARGFLKRLGEGRKSVFMVLMTLSIFGTMVGFNYRDYAFVGIIFLLIFIFSFVYTFYAWRRDDQMLLEKELDKLRDQLQTDFLRSINDIERENVRETEEKIHEIKERVGKRHSESGKLSNEDKKSTLQNAKKQLSEKESIIKQLIQETGGIEEKLRELCAAFNDYQHKFEREVSDK